jgi:hypothetical protein
VSIAVAASAGFASPLGYQKHLMVYASAAIDSAISRESAGRSTWSR